MRVIQLTDSHVSADPAATYRGFDPRDTLERLLEPLREWSPDVVLATGDLSEDGSPASYAWLAGALSGLGVPVLATPGNHDDPAVMHRYFADSAISTPLVHELDGWRLVLLDSTVTNEVSGRLDKRQLGRLEAALAASSLPTLVALHHQPMPVGSAWIDRYPLLEPGEFWSVLEGQACVRLVTWGHVHHSIERAWKGVTALGSPSSVCNSLPEREAFTLDPAGPACRWFELRPDGRFETGVLGLAPLSRTGAARSRG